MNRRIDVTRRQFLQIGAATGGALLIGIDLAACAREEPSFGAAPVNNPDGQPLLAPNAWVRIAKDDTVTLLLASSEMGQGVMTAIPMLLAEELDADWTRVRAEFAPAHPDYANPLLGRQQTGGSTAIRAFWRPLRETGAAVRELLISAAAKTWNVPASECSTEPGVVVHAASGRRARYGELVEVAATLPVPATAFLKEPAQWRYLGKPLPRLDAAMKANGTARFGMDVRLPGMLTAMVARCPVTGGKLKSFDASATKKVKGVRHVVQIDAGVAVVADHFWAAQQGRNLLKVEWDEGPNAQVDSASFRERCVAAINAAKDVRNDGDVAKAMQFATQRLAAVYEVPFVTHACMEPMNCTAHVQRDHCEVWAPTQGQTTAQRQAGRACGLPPEKVTLHTTFLGGGFGRRIEFDYVVEAVQVSKAVKAPVQLVWTREDDIRHGRYRPATYNRLEGGVDAGGNIVAFRHDAAGPSVMARFSEEIAKSGVDRGAASEVPYAIPNVRTTFALVESPVTMGFWRSVNYSQNTFVVECFIDELAHAAGKDPFEARRALLKDKPRLRAVLELAAEKAGWGKPLPKDRARGIAVTESFGSFVAQVAEVSVDNGKVRVHRVTCAVDCGTVVNPAIVTAQMEGGIVFGLTAALKGEITLDHGRVVQSNFNDYPLLRIDEMPAIDVHLIHSDEPPGGIGEPGVPPIAPAVANAVFALTGTPVRSLPIRL